MRGKVEAVRNDDTSEWGWFLAWLAVGACVALGLAALLSVGVILIAVGAVAAVFLLRRGHTNALVGSIAGVALPLFYIAYTNRGGPGDVCHTTATGSTCTEEYAPVPFLIAGAVLFVGGFLVFLVLDHRRKESR
ncbi:hypothetical protein [Streptomyces gibsoniae]|uniref:Integral membrane protein n=1 Tax=Streptomyces gibsoniae TaxID=3075529 RepID=A0ABU2U7X0_9ACTN|nr:hypothetical protein [Streptomyces sp. DSM 41699]MDT0469322.1 hypothetical protein [Streptomyces sp. DSM 41699]